MAVGRSGRKDGLRSTPFVTEEDNFVSDGQCLASSSGNTPALNSFNSFSSLESECILNDEGVTPPVCTITRDSTPIFASLPNYVKPIKPLKKNENPIPKTQSLPTPSSTIEDIPYGNYLAEFMISATHVLGSIERNHFHIPIILGGLQRSVRATALVDSGASAIFMHRRFAAKHKMLLRPLARPITVTNIDGTQNQAGTITHTVQLRMSVGDHREIVDFFVTDISTKDVILGYPWLRRVNPDIDWQSGKLVIEEGLREEEMVVDRDEDDQGEVYKINASRTIRKRWVKEGITDTFSDEVWCAAGFTHSQRIAEEAAKAKAVAPKTFEEMVPKPYHTFKRVFSENESQRLP